MKASAFKTHLRQLMDALCACKAERAARTLGLIEAALPSTGTMSLASLLEAALGAPLVSRSTFATKAGEACQLIRALEPFVAGIGKQAFVEDFRALERALAKSEHVSLEAFSAALSLPRPTTSSARKTRSAGSSSGGSSAVAKEIRANVVDEHVSRIKASVGDDRAFADAFDKLQSDRRVRGLEAAAIATKVAVKTAPSTAKRVALERIQQMQNLQSASDARSKYFEGQSAA
jgi:hypothetical protein